jgi:hypothetical protein
MLFSKQKAAIKSSWSSWRNNIQKTEKADLFLKK